jgi:hypothetical protein
VQDVRRLLYSMKRRFGTPVDLYHETDSQPNVQTGVITQNRIKVHIPDAVFLDQSMVDRGTLSKILGQLTGVMTTVSAAILIDGSEFTDKFHLALKDYVIIEDQRYEIISIKEIDDFESLYIELTEYKGSIKYDIHDIDIKDKLDVVQVLKSIKNHTYDEYLVDELSVNEEIELVNNLTTYIIDTLNITDGIEYNITEYFSRLEIIDDEIRFVETLIL